MNLIAAVDNNWGIGYHGKLLFSLPPDLQHFKRLTENKVVVMGLATFISLPGSKALENRINIVLSDDNDFTAEDVMVCHSLKSLFSVIKQYQPADVFVSGGQAIYELLVDYCSCAYITKVDAVAEADRYFPNIDKMNNWEIVAESPVNTYNDLNFVFAEYINKHPKKH
jgi:dihydrofolate reductase